MFSDYVRNDDLRIYAGDDRPIIWPVTDLTGAPADLSGFTVQAQVRTSPQASAVLQEWSTTNGRAVIVASTIQLLVDDSEDWTWTQGAYDLHLIDGSDRHEVIAWGRVTVLPGVTR